MAEQVALAFRTLCFDTPRMPCKLDIALVVGYERMRPRRPEAQDIALSRR